MPAPQSAQEITHYENFPVASWLCPPHLRPAIAAIYWFARTADDLADEGDATPQQRLDDLAAFRFDLMTASKGPFIINPLAASLHPLNSRHRQILFTHQALRRLTQRLRARHPQNPRRPRLCQRVRIARLLRPLRQPRRPPVVTSLRHH